MKIRIVGRDGREAGFAGRRALVVDTLRVLEDAKRAMRCSDLAARVAEPSDQADPESVGYVLKMLHRIGIVRRERRGVYLLASDYRVIWKESRQPVRERLARPSVEWDALDWSRPDFELARQVGYTRERVRQMRRDLRQADSPFKRHSTKAIALREWLRRNRDRAGALTAEQIQAETGVTLGPEPIARYMRMEGIEWTGRSPPRLATPPRYSLFNWALPNCDLHRIWRSSIDYIAVRRLRSRHGPARWDGRSIHKQRGTAEYEEYRAALQAERRSARAHAKGLAPRESGRQASASAD